MCSSTVHLYTTVHPYSSARISVVVHTSKISTTNELTFIPHKRIVYLLTTEQGSRMKLHEQRDFYQNEARYFEMSLMELLNYVSSDKFTENPMVNTADIQLRIHEILNTRPESW